MLFFISLSVVRFATPILGRYRYRFLFGTGGFMLLFLCGYILTQQKTERYHTRKITLPGVNQPTNYLCHVTSSPIEKPNSIQLIGNISGGPDTATLRGIETSAILYFETSDAATRIEPGDRLMIRTRINEIGGPQNPGEFNYKRFMARKGIFYQAYVSGEDWQLIRKDNGFSVRKVIANIRNRFFMILKKNGLKKDEFDVAVALTMGYDDTLDPEIRQQYAGAGAMHILCVSGLHVGIIYLFFSFMFRFLRGFKNGNIYQAIILILIIWSYALLTGMSPSVMRASTMFSFMAIGKTFKRHTNIYNTLAASAFLLLVIDPLIIAEVGFQLSYTAVLAIVSFQPILYRLWTPGLRIVDKLWAIITVSLAAQLGTFPLAVHYFHQFPNYFLLTNIIVIPLSFIIVFNGLLIAIFSWWPFILKPLVFMLYYLVKGLNFSVGFINQFPYALSENLSLLTSETMLLYAIILLSGILLIKENLKYFKPILLCICFMATLTTYSKFQRFNKSDFFVFSVRGHTALGFNQSGHYCFLADSALLSDEKKLSFHIVPGWIEEGIKDPKIYSINKLDLDTGFVRKEGNFICFNGSIYYLLNNKTRLPSNDQILYVDFLILANDPRKSIGDILKRIHPETIIFASSNKYWNIEKWKLEADSLGVKYYDVTGAGCFSEQVK